jgi:hypothetical protein
MGLQLDSLFDYYNNESDSESWSVPNPVPLIEITKELKFKVARSADT